MSKELEMLQELKASIDKRDSDLSKLAENALAQAQKSGEVSAETKAAVDKMLTDQNGDRIKLNALEVRLGEAEQMFVNADFGGQAKTVKSASDYLIESEETKAFASKVSSNERGRISVPMPRSALISTDVAEGVVEPHRLPGIMQQPKQRLFVRDLITPGKTTQPAISWVQQTGFTNNATMVPENTKKPESEIEFATKLTGVSTLAHLFKASKQIMDDFTQLKSLVDLELRYGLKYVEEQQLLFGDGTGVNLHGIVPQATKFNKAFAVEKHNAIDDIRLAMLQAQLARLPSSGIVMHYQDWAKVELLKNEVGNYLYGNPSLSAIPSLWSLPIVETEIASFVGKFLTGGFAGGAQIFDREDANVVISTENNDDFEKNMITIRCEERLALALYRPEAFVYGDFTIDASTGG